MERHSITIAGRRTNVTLENGFWVRLRGIAKQRHETLSHLVANIKANNRQTNQAGSDEHDLALRRRRHREREFICPGCQP